MDDQFYLRFEDRFRGSREEITQRLGFYRPFIRTLGTLFPTGRALDLGCGRGEWLELLGAEGFSARGVDCNQAMLTTCRDLGLQVDVGDAVSALKEREDNSMALISAFHLIEHLPFDEVLTLVGEAHRVLTAGGLLILETPNPENIIVASVGFHMDPTHRRPLPPALLDFVAEDVGFSWRRCCRIGNQPAMREDTTGLKASDQVLNALATGPDYCLLAGKPGELDTGKLLAVVEETQRIHSMETRSLQERLTEIDWRHEVELRKEREKYHQAETRRREEDAKQQSRLEAVRGENIALNNQLDAVYSSASWRLTAGLRACRRWLGPREQIGKESPNTPPANGSIASGSSEVQTIRNDLERASRDTTSPPPK